MLRLSNNFNVVEMLIKKCKVDITILKKHKKIILYKGKELCVCNYEVNAMLKNTSTNKTLFVEKITFSKDETLKNLNSNTLNIRKNDIKFDFSIEEHIIMVIVCDAGLYQEYVNNKSKNIKEFIKKNSDIINLFKIKSYYDFIEEALN